MHLVTSYAGSWKIHPFEIQQPRARRPPAAAFTCLTAAQILLVNQDGDEWQETSGQQGERAVVLVIDYLQPEEASGLFDE